MERKAHWIWRKIVKPWCICKKGVCIWPTKQIFFFFLVLTVWLRASLTSMFPHLVKSCILVESIGIERFSSCTECISGTFRSLFLSLFYWIKIFYMNDVWLRSWCFNLQAACCRLHSFLSWYIEVGLSH